MAPFIPDGVYKIRNGEFTRFVADLIKGIPYGPISAYMDRITNRNDKWIVRNVGGGGNRITLQSLSTPESYVDAKQFPGASLVGSGNEAIWTVVKVDGGRYYLQSENPNFVWDLPHGADYVKIKLEYHSGKDNQKWTFEEIDD